MGKRIRTESLTDLVFAHRNRSYGSYLYRRKYLKTLLISAATGTFLFLLMVLGPFFWYMLRQARMDLEMDYLYEVEYIPFAPPEDVQLVEMARAHSAPPEEKLLVPVVTDTIPPQEERKPSQEISAKMQEEPEAADSSSYGLRGSETGRQANADTGIATTIDVYPRYPGGEEARLYYLRRHASYPKEAMENGIQGIVTVVFVIEADGSVTNVSLLHGIGGGCDEEAVRVTRGMPAWTPGKRSGRPVRVMVKMPIIFRLPRQ